MTDKLWQQLAAFKVSQENIQLDFTRRLARDNGWPVEFAEKVVMEYKRFLYLIAIHKQELTPSDAIDQAWHLHLVYTRSYWEELCQNILGFALHHNPTLGGNNEDARFKTAYERTLTLYHETFGKRPDESIWPPPDKRFLNAGKFVRLNLTSHWTIAKPDTSKMLVAALAVTTCTVAACTEGAGDTDLWFWIKTAIGVFGFIIIVRFLNNVLGGSGGGKGSRGGGDGAGCSSGCGSGCCGGE
ncbi:glycine-rich domain-containing protein [Kaarinaea lacus]